MMAPRPTPRPGPADAARFPLTDAAAVAAAVALLAAALLPAVVGFVTTTYFDMDPRSVPGGLAVTQFGPAGLAWLQAGAVAAAGLALAVHAAAGGRVRPLGLVLLAGGAAAAAVHLGGGAAHRVTVGSWLAGACVGVAAMHLGQHPAARRVMAAALVALILPLVLDAAWYVWVGHPMTVESFRQQEEAFMAARGWEPGSPQHELYVRRLLADDAVGTFGLSNVLGTLAAGLTALAAAVGLGAWLDRGSGVNKGRGRVEHGGAWLLPGVLAGAGALLGAYLVWMTRSRGAVVALGLGLVLLAGLSLGRRWRGGRGLGRAAGAAGLACVGLAVLAVVVRGLMGAPETQAGERSVLFRFHYAQAAGAALVEAGPTSWAAGLGPGGFETAYLRLKNPVNPEEVQSAHSVTVDYAVMLGAGGACWLGLLGWWLWRGGVAAGRSLGAGEDAEEWAGAAAGVSTWAAGSTRVWLVPAGVLGVVLFGTQYAVELPEMVIETALLWLAGALGFVAVTAALSRRGAAAARWTTAGLFVAAAVVLTQSQIEMGFYQPSSAAVMWLIAGLAGAGRPASAGEVAGPGGVGGRWVAWGTAGGLLAGAVTLAVLHAGPVTAHQGAMREAAALLRAGQGSAALGQLDAAQRVLPADELTARWAASLRLEAAQAMLASGRALWADRFVSDAAETLAAAQDAGAGAPVLDRLWVRLWELRARLAEPEAAVERARAEVLAAQRRVLAKAPYSVSDHVRLGDMLWDRGERAAAGEAYRAALHVSELRYLDPATQLDPETRRRLRERVAAIEAAGPEPSR